MRYTIIALLAIVAFILLSTFPTSAARSQPILCQDVIAIFARGSGREIHSSKEWARFGEQLGQRLKESNLRYSIYELGSQSQDGYQYPAVSIDNFSIKLGAWISAGTAHTYGESVKKGNLELAAYLARITTTCPDSKIVLAGYSQGAHVMSNAIRSIPPNTKDRITFVALFGDPKLHLPEGEGFNPPACQNEFFSPWRRIVEDCHTDNGALGARQPYVSQDMENKVGLWCLDDDFICGSSKNPWVSNGHQQYDRQNGPIDQAAQEIAEKLKTSFTYQTHLGDINTAPDLSKTPSVAADIVFIVDRTISMQEDYPSYFLPKMRKLAQSLGPETQFGFDTYIGCWNRDLNDPYKWELGEKLATPGFGTYRNWENVDNGWLTTDTVDEYTGTPYFSQEPECDPSWELEVRVVRALNDFGQYTGHSQYPYKYWPANSHQLRIIIPITNTPYEPENDTPLGTNGLYTQATTSPDTFIYPIAPDDILDSFESLEDLGDAEVRLHDSDTIDDVLIKQFGTNSQIDARLDHTDYRIPSGTTITFNASSTIIHDDTITKYEWDFNNDSIIDTTTTQPSISHTYSSAPFENFMTVRVTTASGLTSSAEANVQLINLAYLPPIPKAPHNLKLEPTGQGSVIFSWEPSDALADKWMIHLNDVPLGYTEKNQTSIEITDIRTTEDTTFGVRAISSQYEQSEIETITLPAKDSTLLPSNTSLNSANPQYQPKPTTPAANLVEAFVKIFKFKSNASSLTNTLDSHNQASRKSPVTLFYYIFGGIIATAILSLIAWRIYRYYKAT